MNDVDNKFSELKCANVARKSIPFTTFPREKNTEEALAVEWNMCSLSTQATQAHMKMIHFISIYFFYVWDWYLKIFLKASVTTSVLFLVSDFSLIVVLIGSTKINKNCGYENAKVIK